MVARRELKVRLMNKASVISLVIMVGLIAIGTGVGYYFQHRDSTPPQITIGVDVQASALDPALSAAAKQQGIDLTVTATTEAKGRSAVTDGTLAGLLLGDPGAPRLLVADKPNQSMLSVVSAAVQTYVVTTQITDLGGNPTTFEQALAAASPQVDAIAPSGAAFDDAAFGVAMVMIAMLFGTLVATGSMIAMGVVEEKTSRVVEVLLATIRPSQLFSGKVLGVGLYGLFQVVVLGTAATIAGVVLGAGSLLHVQIGVALLWLVIWFLLGYLVYALLFGGFAALVSRQEEIGSVTTPLMFLLLIPFYATMFLVPNDPGSTAVRVLSPLPFFSPFMMPVRSAMGAVQGWEMALAIGLDLITIPALVWLASRVYHRGVLHTGGRMKLSEALRSQPRGARAAKVG
jgi:ABC-2 type transport system permease protein